MMMDTEREAIVGVTFRRSAEKILALSTLALGISLAAFPDSFAAPSYAFMKMIGPAPVWIVWLVMLGSSRMAFLIANGYYRFGPEARSIMSLTSLMTVWSPISAGFAFNFTTLASHDGVRQFYPSVALAPACMAFEGLSLFALFTLWRVKRDFRRIPSESHRGDTLDPGRDRGGADSEQQSQADLERA